MFEKSLFDLIRGLRARKGDERAYILENLKECRKEVRSQDGDIKATAILKLIYLEMFGHDMSWASFHVLEVMASTKFLQKRIGYLAAIQSFTLDTDVLMLATNLLKKDLSSSSPYDISLAVNGLSHIVSPSLAQDLAPDLITKMNHSNPYIRKKAILVMYKCFLQSPELLRTAWPRLREGLNDDDPSVVNATVNVICELARKNPRNYLPLAPQLFGLLTSSGNNWMTIKIIKLFATLTPLEPRLTKKLVPPIINLIRTTPAMSLLYECINGLISGGLLAAMGETNEGEELASVCVTKLRGFLIEGDSNLKYVGLLAFTKIVSTHSHLVALHQDVILDCIDDPDITIRLRALELVVGMVTAENLQTVVARLMRQLRPQCTPPPGLEPDDLGGDDLSSGEEDSYTGRPMGMKTKRKFTGSVPLLPESYKVGVIKRILEMCSREMYANIPDFRWYLDVLIQLVRLAPPVAASSGTAVPGEYCDSETDEDEGEDGGDGNGARDKDVGEDIGYELRNVAVRVKSVRAEAVGLADMLVHRKEGVFPLVGGGGHRVLFYAGWVVGEYASQLSDPESTLHAITYRASNLLSADILAIYIQALPKIYAAVVGSALVPWTMSRKSSVALLTDCIVKFLEPHATSPDLEVQERAVEFLELFRLAVEAVTVQPTGSDDAGNMPEPPRILTQAIPEMFAGMELNPVAPLAQRKVPLPPNLDLDEPINPRLHELIGRAALFSLGGGDATDEETDKEEEEFCQYYYTPRFIPISAVKSLQQQLLPASTALDLAATASGRGVVSAGPGSFQYQTAPDDYFDEDIVQRRKAERRERNALDPFYIGGGDSPRVGATPPNPLRGEEVDVDSIPVVPLDPLMGDLLQAASLNTLKGKAIKPRVEIVGDEELEGSGAVASEEEKEVGVMKGKRKGKKAGRHPLLGVTGSSLIGFPLEEDDEEKEKKEKVKEEVRRVRAEVERFRKELESRQASAEAEVLKAGTKAKLKAGAKSTDRKGKAGVNAEEGEQGIRSVAGRVKKTQEGTVGEGDVKSGRIKASRKKRGVKDKNEMEADPKPKLKKRKAKSKNPTEELVAEGTESSATVKTVPPITKQKQKEEE